MKLKTWEEFEESFNKCLKCDQPEGSYKGLFCHYHCTKFEEVYNLLCFIPNKGGKNDVALTNETLGGI